MFLNRGKATTPLAMRANVEHNHVLHEHVVILSIETLPVPHVAAAERLAIDDLGYTDDGITHVTARFGYMDEPNVPARAAPGRRRPTSSARSRSTTPPTSSRRSSCASATRPGMSRWRKRLFLATSRITADAAEYFGLPARAHGDHGLAHRGLASYVPAMVHLRVVAPEGLSERVLDLLCRSPEVTNVVRFRAVAHKPRAT